MKTTLNSSLGDFGSSVTLIDSYDDVPFLLGGSTRPSLLDRVIYWHDSMTRSGDERLKHLPLIGSPIPITVILLLYVLFVKVIGPYFMRDRTAFELKNTLIIYNALMVIVSASQFLRGGIYGWFGSYSWTCQPIDYSNSRDGIGMAFTAYIYYLSKVVELLDTVFFVLRKKQSQVTTLHVTHHAGMAVLMYVGVKFWAGGHGSFQGFVNSFVHIFMYSYYLLSGLGPQFGHLLWWKKYITQLQLAQFAIIFVHGFQLFLQPNCNYPRVILYPYLLVCAYFTVMFINFYRKAYQKRRSLATQQNLIMTGSEESEGLILGLQHKVQQQELSEKRSLGSTEGKGIQSLVDMIDLRKRHQSTVFQGACNEESGDQNDSDDDLPEEISSKKVL